MKFFKFAWLQEASPEMIAKAIKEMHTAAVDSNLTEEADYLQQVLSSPDVLRIIDRS